MMAEVAEAPIPTETREEALKMVTKVPNILETTARELNFMESEAVGEGIGRRGGATLSSHMQWRR